MPVRCSRRQFLLGAAALGFAGWAGVRAVRADLPAEAAVLKAAPTTFPLDPPGPPEVFGAWGYNGRVPGPTLRFKQGERLHVMLENALPDATSIHWHGIRLPNAMDGVPHLTQPPVEPGARFEYEFDLPDAGTFWYHPHLNASEQLGRGLLGALIIDEPEPYPAERDLLWLLDDWRLDAHDEIADDFNSRHDVSHAGRIGDLVTINGKLPHVIDVRPGERIRLRLLNAANARNFALHFGGLPVHVIALDGQPVEPHEPQDGLVVLGAGMRVDVVLDCVAEAGSYVDVFDDFYRGREYPLMGLRITGEPLPTAAPGVPPALPPNPLAEPDLANAVRHELLFEGGMRGSLPRETMMPMLMQGKAWTVNGDVIAEHDHAHHSAHPPLFTLARNSTCHLTLRNDTQWYHPIHLHGHHFRVLTRDGQPEPHQPWRDTVLMAPMETVEIAFVADNPGDWMLHCHVLEHHAGGMGGVFHVTRDEVCSA